jgi:carbonic anhydrase
VGRIEDIIPEAVRYIQQRTERERIGNVKVILSKRKILCKGLVPKWNSHENNLHNALALRWEIPTISLDHPVSFPTLTGSQEAQMIVRILVVTLLVFSGFSASSTSDTPQDKKSASECSDQPFSYDHGATGQQSWCGRCNESGAVRQAPINISNTQESAQPPIVFNRYNENTNLVIYPHNPYNLKVDYKSSSHPAATISVGSTTFRLLEFHFHRPSEEAIDNRRFPMVLHLVHLKNEAGCEPGKPGCVAAIAILIKEGTPEQRTTDLLNILFSHFPPPAGPQNVQINLEGLLPPNYVNAGYWSYGGSLTTPPCTDNITFYVLKPTLTFSAAQIAEFERRYSTPNARDIQPLDGRPIVNRR